MKRRQLAAIVLLIVGAGLFAIGTAIEKSRHHDEPVVSSEVGESHDEEGESVEQREAEEADGHSESSGSEEGKILGVDRESTGLVVAAVLASLALAALLWQRPTRVVWVVVALVSLIFAVFDIAEVAHQLDESATGLAVLASLVAATHVVIVVLAAGDVASRRATT